MALSLLRIVNHSYHPHTAVLAIGERGEWLLTPAVPGAITEAGRLVYRFGASLFYYNATRFSTEVLDLVRSAPSPVHYVVVDAGPIANVDYTAARAVRQLKEDLDRGGVVLAFAHVQSDLRADLDRHYLTEVIGAGRLFDTLRDALAWVRSNRV